MNKIRISEFEISEIADKLSEYTNKDSKQIAEYAVALVLHSVNHYIINNHLMTLDEVADTFQNLLDLINDEKYRPLIKFLGTIGGD